MDAVKSLATINDVVGSLGPAEGAMFLSDVSRSAIFHIECTNPFKKIKLFDLSTVNKEPLTVEQLPLGYRPYSGCLFDVLSEPDNDKRFEDLCSFFRTLGSRGDKGRECGLTYTIMHLWPMIYAHQRYSIQTKMPYTAALFEYFVDAGMIEFFFRILSYGLERKFLHIEFNRYAPYRILECLVCCTHVDQPHCHAVVHRILANEQISVDIFLSYLNGKVSSLEAMVATQVIGNLSNYVPSMTWLLHHPSMCAAAAKFLWTAYTDQYSAFRQHQDLQSVYQRTLHSNFQVNSDEGVVMSDVTRLPQMTHHLGLQLMVNICAAYPEDNTLSQVEPSILAVVEEGLHDHVGDVMCGILLNYDVNPHVSPEKFTSVVSWSVFQSKSQKLAIEQLRRLPYTRRDKPPFFSRQSYAKSRSVIAFLITHSLWFDDNNAANYATLGVISLLRQSDEIAMEIIRFAGDLLYDLAHSIHIVKLPDDKNPSTVKSAILEVFLKLGGFSYYTQDKTRVAAGECKFDDPVPQCIKDAKEFCERHLREEILPKTEKQRLVRCADSFKTEGNEFFQRDMFHDAIVCYTKALEICPLTCVERRVTYYSNRAECFIKSNQPRRAVSDCTRAIAQNPDTFKVRWRRAQALSQIGAKHLAALDFFTIAHRNDTSAISLLGLERWEDLKTEYRRLLEHTFPNIAEQQLGNIVYRGHMTREYGQNVDVHTVSSSIPPYTGQPLFGVEEGRHIHHVL